MRTTVRACCQACASPQTLRIMSDEIGFTPVRSHPGQARRGTPRVARPAVLRLAHLYGGSDPPGTEGAQSRARILALLSRSRARIQSVVQFLCRHERRRGGALSEGRAHRASADLAGRNDRRQGPPSRPPRRPRREAVREGFASDDPFDVLREFGGPRTGAAHGRAEAERRTVRNAERKALHALGLDEGAPGAVIKTSSRTW